MMKKIRGLFLSFLLLLISISAFSQHKTMISGKVLSTEKTTVDFATVYLKGTNYGGTTNEEGIYHLQAPAGEYTLVVSAIGYKTVEKPVKLMRGERTKMNVVISPQATELDEVVVVSNGVTRLKRSAFNAVALDTKALQNSTQNLSEDPGVRRCRLGYATDDGWIYRQAYQDLYRWGSARRCRQFFRTE